jgi:hypothetical protein
MRTDHTASSLKWAAAEAGFLFLGQVSLNVGFWHKADMARLSSDVRFWG